MTTITVERELLEQALEVIFANTVGAEEIEDAIRAALSAPATAPERKPIPFSTFYDWFSQRMRACGPDGITDQNAFAEEVMRWTEAFHGITGGKT